MANKKNLILISIITLILGALVVRQFYLQKKINQVSQPKAGEALAYQVAELIKDNSRSQEQITNLEEQYNKLEKSSTDLKTAKETLEEKNKVYQVILGTAEVQGPGVIITFDEKIHSTQLIDLINALKNIGIDSISINNKKITPTSSVNSGLFNPPIIVKAIGNSDLLTDSLTRPGGIIPQIGLGNVEKKDHLEF